MSQRDCEARTHSPTHLTFKKLHVTLPAGKDLNDPDYNQHITIQVEDRPMDNIPSILLVSFIEISVELKQNALESNVNIVG